MIFHNPSIITFLVFNIIFLSILRLSVATKDTLLDHSSRQDWSTSIPVCKDPSYVRKSLRYGPCDNACIRYGRFPRSVHEEVCSENSTFGCALLPCAGFGVGADEVAACSLDKSIVEAQAQLCPGDGLVFDSVDITRFGEVSYSVDLNSGGEGGDRHLTDVYLVADTTGSMRTAVRTAQMRANDIFKLFGYSSADDGDDKVRFGVGEYKDESDFVDGFRNIQALTAETGDVVAAMGEWSASGGGDEDEATLVALYRIATDPSIGWRTGSKRYVVLLGDYPGHEPTCATGTPLTRERVVSALKVQDITLLITDFRSMNTREPQSYPRTGCAGIRRTDNTGQASFLARRTGGALVRNRDQSQLVELIEQALQKIPVTYNIDESECAPYIVSTHSPALPLKGTTGAGSTNVKNTFFLIKETVCGRRSKAFSCTYKYMKNGEPINDGIRLEFVNVQGCVE